MKSDRQLKAESNARILGRIVFGISTGIISELFLNWRLLFMLIAGYCLFESAILFSVVRRTQLLKAKLENHGKILTPEEMGKVIGHSQGFALSFAMTQFPLSFITISVFAAFAKWITGLF